MGVFRAWKYGFLGSICLLAGLYIYINDKGRSFNPDAIQRKFNALEKEQLQYAKKLLLDVKANKPLPNKPDLVYHLYDKNILFGWNSNQLPIGRYKTDLFPKNGLVKLNNGWYYCRTIQEGSLSCCVSFCLLKEYEFSNAYLRASNPSFWNEQFKIGLKHGRHAVLNNQKQFVFYASPLPSDSAPNKSDLEIFFFIIAGILILYQLQVRFVKSLWANLSLLIGLVVIRTMLYEIHWPKEWLDSNWFSAGFFAYNEWYPDFFSFVINGLFILFGVRIFLVILRILSKKWLNTLALSLPILIWAWIEIQLNIIIEHSNLPLGFDHLFDLDITTFFFFTLLGLYIYTFQKSVYIILQQNRSENWFNKGYKKLVFLGIPFLGLLFIDFSSISALPLIVICIQVAFFNTNNASWYKLSSQLLILTLNAAIIAFFLQNLQFKKDLENRALFAQQLAIERNINLELAYAQAVQNFINDEALQLEFDTLRQQYSKVGFEHAFIQKYLNGIWDGFDIDIELYDGQDRPCFGADSLQFQNLKHLVQKHGQQSDIESEIYFMPHEEEGLSYVILLPLTAQRTLAITLVSKRIPEEIGFPRLLISDQAGISNNLEQYAIGKYAEGGLIHQSGSFNYPLRLDNLTSQKSGNTIIESNGYIHVVVSQQAGAAIIISTPQQAWYSNVTGFAFLFVFWGLLLISQNMLKSLFDLKQAQWSLSFKVQIAFLIILGLSLFLYGLGSSLFIGEQFDRYTQQALREKLAAVHTELNSETSRLDTLDAVSIGKKLELKLSKLASVFNTDLFVFDSDGFLIASSRPSLFAYGLIGEHMNPQAMDALLGGNKSYFSHQDQIGTLSYRSAYLPIMSQQKRQIGFINLQLFGQQEAYELQLENFLKAAINVFVLLLAISVFIALLVSNWLVGPLQLVARSVRGLEFGKNNQKIKYQNNDEIGLLVRAYNDKLAELEQFASQIARNEREGAWRDLAQQIAHEIKNPLTPMKLSIQHILHKMESDDVNAQELIKTALPNLLDQIDALARMANEFARFAKLPEPIFEKIELNTFITQTVQLFDEEQNLIHFNASNDTIWIQFDKDMLSQVFNNLLLNAKQATETKLDKRIDIVVSSSDTHILIQFKDNGVGIIKSEYEKIFTPHFTTKSSGSGIGLSVVRQIIEKHEGKIWFESARNKGSIFFLEFKRLNEN